MMLPKDRGLWRSSERLAIAAAAVLAVSILIAGVLTVSISTAAGAESGKLEPGKPEPAKILPKSANGIPNLATRVRAAVRQEAASAGAKHEVAVRELAKLHGEVQSEEALPSAERRRMQTAIRGALVHAARRIETARARRDNLAPIAAQRFGPAGGRPGAPSAIAVTANQPTDHGQELLELIRDTVAPDTWDTRGGSGTIAYFRQTRSLIARQQLEVHEEIRDLLGALRK